MTFSWSAVASLLFIQQKCTSLFSLPPLISWFPPVFFYSPSFSHLLCSTERGTPWHTHKHIGCSHTHGGKLWKQRGSAVTQCKGRNAKIFRHVPKGVEGNIILTNKEIWLCVSVKKEMLCNSDSNYFSTTMTILELFSLWRATFLIGFFFCISLYNSISWQIKSTVSILFLKCKSIRRSTIFLSWENYSEKGRQ